MYAHDHQSSARAHFPAPGPVVVQRNDKKKRYRRRPDSATSSTDRSPGLRALDRIARLTYGAPDPKGTPHLAVTLRPDRTGLTTAGNTGNRRVTEENQERFAQRFSDFGEEYDEDDAAWSRHFPKNQAKDREDWNRRVRKDRLKLHALQAGDYAAGFGEDAAPLQEIAEASRGGLDWADSLVGDAEKDSWGSQHGEMTRLGKWIEHWRGNPRIPRDPPQIIPMGGVKKACLACHWAFEATNMFIGEQLGYRVVASGTHSGLFPGWIMPEFLAGIRSARELLERWAGERGGEFVEIPGRRLKLVVGFQPGERDQDPSESESEWEEYDEG